MLEVDSEQNLENSTFKRPSWYLIGQIYSRFDRFLALFFVSGVTLETSSLKKNVSISFLITSLLKVAATFTGLLRLIPIHFLNDVFIFLGREDEDCMFNFVVFFLLRGDILFHMKEEQDKSESSNPSEQLSTAAGFLINDGSFKRNNLHFCLLKAFFLTLWVSMESGVL